MCGVAFLASSHGVLPVGHQPSYGAQTSTRYNLLERLFLLQDPADQRLRVGL